MLRPDPLLSTGLHQHKEDEYSDRNPHVLKRLHVHMKV